MAGSNGFLRTHKQQDDWAEETADATTLVQIAIVYRGTEIEIYRNAELLAQYDAGSAESFGDENVVWLGRRHYDAQLANRYFVGTIDDARIYDVALDSDQIAALKANQASTPAPLAWWDFERGQVRDRMGRYPISMLLGGARVEAGKLHLDTPGDQLLASRAELDIGLATENMNQADRTARALREKLLSDPHRPGYHFVTPEGRACPSTRTGPSSGKGATICSTSSRTSADTTGDTSPAPICSTGDTIRPGLIAGMFSGNCFLNKDGRPTMCYHQVGQGNAMAVAARRRAERVEEAGFEPDHTATEPGDPHHGKYRSWDPYGWLEGRHVLRHLRRRATGNRQGAEAWTGHGQYVGDLLANTVDGRVDQRGRLVRRLLQARRPATCCSASATGSAAATTWANGRTSSFIPTFHEQMSWVDNSFFAPESLLDDRGRRIMWAWIFDSAGLRDSHRFRLVGDHELAACPVAGPQGRLQIQPPEELQRLRYDARQLSSRQVAADSEVVLDTIRGNSLELELEISAAQAVAYGLKVCCAPDESEQTAVYYDARQQQLTIDARQSSQGEGAKTLEAGPLVLEPGQRLQLRVFVDKSVVEVFANGRQAVMRRIYPTRPDSLEVRLFSRGGPAEVHSIRAWSMTPSNAY